LLLFLLISLLLFFILFLFLNHATPAVSIVIFMENKNEEDNERE